MKAAFLVLAMLAGAAIPLCAQAQPQGPAPAPQACAIVNGYVTDGTQPLAGVTVLVQDSKLLTITNGDGFFTLTLESAAPAKLLFDAAGYEPRALTTAGCQNVRLELPPLPGTRIRQRGKHKGSIMKAGELPTASN